MSQLQVNQNPHNATLVGVRKPKKRFFPLKKKLQKNIFFCIYLLVMPKYWGKQIFTHGRFPEGSGSKAKDGERKKERERDEEKD